MRSRIDFKLTFLFDLLFIFLYILFYFYFIVNFSIRLQIYISLDDWIECIIIKVECARLLIHNILSYFYIKLVEI